MKKLEINEKDVKKDARAQDNSLFRVLGSWKEGPTKQTYG